MVEGVAAKTDLVDTIICLTLDQGCYQHISNSDWSDLITVILTVDV